MAGPFVPFYSANRWVRVRREVRIHRSWDQNELYVRVRVNVSVCTCGYIYCTRTDRSTFMNECFTLRWHHMLQSAPENPDGANYETQVDHQSCFFHMWGFTQPRFS
jgi:hypothetical protein